MDDLEQLARDLCGLFPDLKGLGPLKRLADGASSIVVESAGDFVFRVGKNPQSVASYRNEAQLLPALHDYVDLPIPRMPALATPPRTSLSNSPSASPSTTQLSRPIKRPVGTLTDHWGIACTSSESYAVSMGFCSSRRQVTPPSSPIPSTSYATQTYYEMWRDERA